MEILKEPTKFDFLGWRWVFILVTTALLAMTAYLWFGTGDEKFGVDFRGGTEIVARFNADTKASDIRNGFEEAGFKEVIVQAFENGLRDFSVRLSQDQSSEEAKAKVKAVLEKAQPAGYTLLKEDYVGPIIGDQIRRDAYIAIFLSIIAILIYVGSRFEWEYGVGGIVALIHDVVIAIGFCLLTGVQLSAGILAAMLTIVGYSINDTIVIYDRIRENVAKHNKAKKKVQEPTNAELTEIMNRSMNETLSRTILTSLTAFFSVTTLWVFGGGAVVDMAFALMVGVVVGCYSTIFIACPTVLFCRKLQGK